MSHLLSLDRHDVLETIRKSNSLREAFLGVAKLPAAGEYHPCTNADRLRQMSDEELAVFIRDQIIDRNIGIPTETWLSWLKSPGEENE